MEKTEFRRQASDMIYLTICAINGKVPKKERIERLDLQKLFEVCQKHILTACVAYALESAGVHDHEFTQAKEKAIRKNILLDAERAKIFRRLEAEKIWYMPLKGAILKDWYPKLGMRQMSDNDILFDMSRRDDVRKIMQENGFALKAEREVVDEYLKEPLYNFEMHGELFMDYQVGEMAGHYLNIKQKLLKDTDNAYGYHFSYEDFYIFMLAHEYKHFILSGTGVRALADTYVFLRKFGEKLDREYLDKELRKLGIAEYEKNNRELSMKIFNMTPLNEEEKKLLEYHVMSGVYGIKEHYIHNKIKRNGHGSKARYMLYRLFPPVKYLRVSVPWVKKSRLLIPAAYIYRLIRGGILGGDRLKSEADVLMK